MLGLSACGDGLPLMATYDAPPTRTPPQPFLPPSIAAGRPLMKTSREPSTTGAPLAVPSPTRAAGLRPIVVSGLPWVMTPAGWAATTVSPQHEMTGTASNNVSVRMESLIAQLDARSV